MKQRNLTEGNIAGNLILFSLPMMVGNLLQQCYNIADTLIVGRYLGADALAAVGSSYTLMTFLTSILIGLCMGSGVAFSNSFGEKNDTKLKKNIINSFVLIAATTLALNILVYLMLPLFFKIMQVPVEIIPDMGSYLVIIFAGITATFLYNYFAAFLRAIGNSVVPLVFLGISAVLNIILDLIFVIKLNAGVEGAAWATVISQYVSGIGIAAYTWINFKNFRIKIKEIVLEKKVLKEIAPLAFFTCLQQSVMNFGILMVQGRVNSFGTSVMAAFAAAVKIDSLAYMPVQDFGNAFSTYIAQNYGAKKNDRIEKGIKSAVMVSFIFCIIISTIVCLSAGSLMGIFVDSQEIKRAEIISIGVKYLRIEGAFYFGIGILFLLYGYYRAVNKPVMSVILTVLSLGTRVILAYTLSAIPALGVTGIWISVPVGWALADITGAVYYKKERQKI